MEPGSEYLLCSFLSDSGNSQQQRVEQLTEEAGEAQAVLNAYC